MSAAATDFLPPRVQVLALPSASKPRLYLSSENTSQRWRHSGLYPAFRWSARAFRTVLRMKAAFGLGRTWRNHDAAWVLGEFLKDCLPSADAAVVLLGTPGPTQKVTVQLWEGPTILGYLKYAETPIARARLDQEYVVLTALPVGAGPRPLKFAPFDRGQALVTAPAPGHTIPTRSQLGTDLRSYLSRLRQADGWPLAQHPWVVRLREGRRSEAEPLLAPLAAREWSVVFQHGDFAPWNILRRMDGTLTAVDWEYGSTQGFPYLDAAHYLLQVAALMRRWSPQRARTYAAKHLSPDLSRPQAEALVRLSAFAAYNDAKSDGQESRTPLQAWRRAVWEAS